MSILVVVEQREGKLNRVSMETLTAAQALAAETGWPLEAVVVGSNVAAIASEVAGKKLAKVYAIENAKLEPYTPDAFAHALKQFVTTKNPKLVLMPHTYQVRDFIPKLATGMGRTAISDCIGYKKEGEKLVFTRQMFQGKLAADVSFTSEAPWFVTFQNGAFRGDKVEAGASAAPVETVNVDIPDGVIRNKPQEIFKEAKQAVDLTQAPILVAVGRGIKEQKHRTRQKLAEALAASWLLRSPSATPDGFRWTARSVLWPDRRPSSTCLVLGSNSTHRRHERRSDHRRNHKDSKHPSSKSPTTPS
jgi:electron transfer flavoprotein alpha subunit